MTRVLRVTAWLSLAAGIALAAALWATAVDRVVTEETIVGHATVTFEGVRSSVSAVKLAGGAAALVGGVNLWALSLAFLRRSG